VLLDTCAVIWLANGDAIADQALAGIIEAGLSGGIYVSVASAWEIGMLSKPKASRSNPLQFLPDAKTWFGKFAAGPGIKLASITPDIAIDASFLPGEMHGDPGDRLIVATARHLGLPVVTRDVKILSYANKGYVTVIGC
jgi:PIN domain nuclease of toxin-antitoxin system